MTAAELSGDATTSGSNAVTLATVNSGSGACGSATVSCVPTTNAKGLVTSQTTATITPAIGSVTGLGTGIATALGVNTGSAGAPVLFNGAGGTPSSINISNATSPPTWNQNTTGTAANLSGTPTVPNGTAATTQSQNDNSTKLATTAYTDLAIANAVAGVNPAVAVQAATTAAGNTSSLTYNNGVSGVGATLTGANNTALTVDGFTFTALGQRLLVKNDTQSPSGAFNGIYYVTQVQALALPLILTRALDYDMPSDMNNTGAIPVVNGTANGTTSWLLTSSVATVGTSPLTYTQFSINPSNQVTAVSPGVGLCHFAGSTQACTSSAVNLANADVTGVLPQANMAQVSPTSGTSVSLTSGISQLFVCTSTCTVTVPAPAAGAQYCAYNDDNVSTVITMSAIGSSARYENTARTAYGTAGTGTFVSGGAVGDAVCLVFRDSTHYSTLSHVGTWTAN